MYARTYDNLNQSENLVVNHVTISANHITISANHITISGFCNRLFGLTR